MRLTEYLFFGALGLILLLIVLAVIDHVGADTRIERAVVQQRFFEAPRAGIGVAGGSNSPVVVFSGASFDLLLDFGSRIELVLTNEHSWIISDEGQEYKFYCRYGYLSGNLLRCTR